MDALIDKQQIEVAEENILNLALGQCQWEFPFVLVLVIYCFVAFLITFMFGFILPVSHPLLSTSPPALNAPICLPTLSSVA